MPKSAEEAAKDVDVPVHLLWTYFEDVSEGIKCGFEGCGDILTGKKTATAARKHLNSKKHREKIRKVVESIGWNDER